MRKTPISALVGGGEAENRGDMGETGKE